MPHYGPAFGGGFIERLVEFADMRVPVVGPELPKAAIGRRPMRVWIPDRLGGFVIIRVRMNSPPPETMNVLKPFARR